LLEILSTMEDPVTLLLFTEEVQCPACQQQQQLLEAVTALSEKLQLATLNPREHQEEIERHAIDKFPATVPLRTGGMEDYGIRFFGITGGQEIRTLVRYAPQE
jgi:hypothetical protein